MSRALFSLSTLAWLHAQDLLPATLLCQSLRKVWLLVSAQKLHQQ